MPAPLVPQCQHCAARAPTALTTKCTKCKAVVYCSAAHLAADATRHGKACRTVVAARKAFAKEDKKLRRMEVDCFMPGKVFEECIGDFYHLYETRPFMDAKIVLVKALGEVGSAVAVEEALREACECVTLDEQDHEAVRDIIPALMLLLGKVQEAYDFIYYCEEEEEDEDDEAMDEDKPPRIVPCLRPTKMNPTDPVDFFVKPYLTSSSHRSALTYIKLITAFGLNGALQQLKNSSWDEQANAPLLEFLRANNRPTDAMELEALYETVLHQAKQAFDLAHSDNRHIWSILVGPVLNNPPSSFNNRTTVPRDLVMDAKLWHATPYAIDYVAMQLQN